MEKINNLEFDGSRFVQFYFEGKPYLRFDREEAPLPSHDLLLFFTLNEFGIKYRTRKGKDGKNILLEKDEERGYEVVGYGKAKFVGSGVGFYGLNKNNNKGPNKKHAKEISKSTGIDFFVLN